MPVRVVSEGALPSNLHPTNNLGSTPDSLLAVLAAGLQQRHEQLRRLSRSRLATVPNFTDVDTALLDPFSEPNDVFAAVLAQGSVRIDLLGNSLTVLH